MSQTFLKAAVIAAVAWLFAMPIGVRAQTPDLSVLDQFRVKHGDKDEVNWDSVKATYEAQHAAKQTPVPPPVSLRPAPVVSAAPPLAVKPAASQVLPASVFAFGIRQNFADVDIFNPAALKDPRSVFDSHGASASLTRDNVTHNSLWSVEGVATAVWGLYTDYAPKGVTQITGLTVAPYVQLDRNLNSNPKLKSKNVDNDGFGGAGEMVVDNLLGGVQYFHNRLGVVDDNIKSSQTIADVLDWLPVYSRYCIHFPCFIGESDVYYRVDPELKLQYDTASSGTVLDFAKRSTALRIGPQLALIVAPFGRDPGLLGRLHFNGTFHWAEELYSHRPFVWLEPTLVFNLDPAGNLGLTLDYKNGHDELSGQKMNAWKISLTGKL